MTKRDIASIALKITGVVLLVQAIISMPLTLNGISMLWGEKVQGYPGNQYLFGALGILTILLQIAAALYLLLKADGTAAWIVREDGPVDLPDAASRRRPLFALAVRVAGVVFLAQGIPGLVRSVVQAVLQARAASEQFGTGALNAFRAGAWIQEWSTVAGSLAAVLVGLYLLFCAERLARLVIRDRSTETAPVE